MLFLNTQTSSFSLWQVLLPDQCLHPPHHPAGWTPILFTLSSRKNPCPARGMNFNCSKAVLVGQVFCQEIG